MTKADKPKKPKAPFQKRAEKSAQRKEWTQAEIDAAMAFPKGKDEPETKRPPGRPSNYPSIDLDRVQRLAAGGLTKYEIAEKLGISETSRKEYENEYPAFAAAIERGRKREVEDVVSAMHMVAMGYTVPEEKVFFDSQTGAVVRAETIKHYQPDVKAQHLILQHAETGSWKPKTEITLVEPIAGKLQKARERAKRP